MSWWTFSKTNSIQPPSNTQNGNHQGINQASITQSSPVTTQNATLPHTSLTNITSTWGAPNQLPYSPFYFYNPPSVLDIKGLEESASKNLTKYEESQKEKDLIDSLHPKTKEIVQLAYELSKSGELKDLKKMDKLVRDMLFNSKLEEILEEKDDPTTPSGT